mmetsp:Transcript_110494/g.165366  ORF Transcript_110494/g.165366 Transcript_110494/m.165366 type:complete len:548 (+) Transcript_110494:108-1751(+)
MRISLIARGIVLLGFGFEALAATVAASLQASPNYQSQLKKATMTEADSSKMSQLLFTSLEKETSHSDLPVSGTIPSWLKGTLVRNGPSLFEIGDESFQHWFDGQAMLHGFTFDGSGKFAYENKLLDTAGLRAHRKAGKIAAKEFVSGPSLNFFQRVAGIFSPDTIPYENANVNVARAGGKYFAMTEVPRWIEFELPGVQAKGAIAFNDALEQGHMCSAHPITTSDGTHISYVTCFGKEHHYLIYKIKPQAPGHTEGGLERELIGKVPTPYASYMHSFGLSDDYVVLVEFPWHFNLFNMLQNSAMRVLTGQDKGLDHLFEWRPERGTTFTVVRRADGAVKGRYKAPAVFAYHHANAFVDPQDPSQLHVDMMCYERVFYEDMSLKSLRSNVLDPNNAHPGQLKRFTVQLEAGEEARGSGEAVKSRVLLDGECEFPRINDRFQGKKYRYVWGTGLPGKEASKAIPKLVRLDAETGETKTWQAAGCYPGEGVFVPSPGEGAEDDGVLMSVVLDCKTERSFLVILDASTMEEVARIDLPHHIPLGLHGFFFQ